jgi:hypothetical protein
MITVSEPKVLSATELATLVEELAVLLKVERAEVARLEDELAASKKQAAYWMDRADELRKKLKLVQANALEIMERHAAGQP